MINSALTKGRLTKKISKQPGAPRHLLGIRAPKLAQGADFPCAPLRARNGVFSLPYQNAVVERCLEWLRAERVGGHGTDGM
jgi:hypothetical protein